jgi:glycosyltransferase involved in cell wall biosynthesis
VTTTFLAVRHALRELRPDVIHVHSLPVLAFPARPAGVAVVGQIHGREWENPSYGTLGRALLRINNASIGVTCAAVAVVSPVLLDFYRSRARVVKWIPAGKRELSRQPSPVLERLGLEPGKYFLYAGRLSPEKNLSTLLKAHAGLKRHAPPLVLAGPEDGSPYCMHLREIADRDRVLFAGALGRRDLDALYTHAGAYVQVSLVEGWSLALLDALCCGLPIVTSDIPENSALVGKAGLYVKPRDEESLRETLWWLARSEELRSRLGAAARARAAELPDWEAVTTEFESLYASVLTGVR